jgi:hypothetical protein
LTSCTTTFHLKEEYKKYILGKNIEYAAKYFTSSLGVVRGVWDVEGKVNKHVFYEDDYEIADDCFVILITNEKEIVLRIETFGTGCSDECASFHI